MKDIKIFDLKKKPIVFNSQDAMNYARRVSKSADLSQHLDICLAEAIKMTPLNLTNKFAIDIGCGEGRWSRLLARRGATVLGIDNNQTMINLAIEKSDGFPTLSFKKLSAEKLSSISKKFDFGIASYVFNNIINLSKIFQACSLSFTNRAQLIIITKTFKSSGNELKKLRDFFLPIKIWDKYTMQTSVFTIDDYVKISQKHNFVLVEHFSQISPDKFSNANLNKTNIIIEDQVMKYQKK